MKDKSMSEISFMENFQDTTQNDVMDALDDVRNCTFQTGLRIEKVISQIEDFDRFFTDTKGKNSRLFLTPHMHQHFEVRELSDFTCLFHILQFQAGMLGFAIQT